VIWKEEICSAVVGAAFVAAISLPGSAGRGAGWVLWGLAAVGVLSIYFRLEAKIWHPGIRVAIAVSIGALAAADGVFIWLGDPGLVLEFVGGGFALVLAWLGVDGFLGWAQDLPARISGDHHYSSPPSPTQLAWPQTDPQVAAARLERKLEKARSRPLQPKPARPWGPKPAKSSQPKPTGSWQAKPAPPAPSPQLLRARKFRDELDDAAPALWRAAQTRLRATYGHDWLTRVNERRVAEGHPEVKRYEVGVDPRVALKVIAYDPAFERTVGPIWGKVRSLVGVANALHHAREVRDDQLQRAGETLRQLLDMDSI
jgi:hypothetical protein